MHTLDATFTTFAIAGFAACGVVVRPWRLPEATWAILAAVALVVLGLMPLAGALGAIARGTDVYLFLVGMMLAAELAREERLFDWLAARAARAAGGSPLRLFTLVYGVGILVTVFLSNDATAVVLTPAVYAAARAARAEPLPHLLACAFIANAASFVLPISNPANLVVFRDAMPPLTSWLARFAAPSLVAIAATYAALLATQRASLHQPIEGNVEVPELPRGGRIVAAGIAAMAGVLMLASALGLDLGLPTLTCGLAMLVMVALCNRRPPWAALKGISWGVLPLVAGLFVVVEAVEATGVLRTFRAMLQSAGGAGSNAAVSVLGIVMALACNLINNLPVGLVAGSVVSAAHLPATTASVMLIGVDLGPNLSVTGSLATILWLTALRREGIELDALRFLRIGAIVMPPALPLAIAAALCASAA